MSNIYPFAKKNTVPPKLSKTLLQLLIKKNQGANQQRDCDANRKISVWINTLFCRIGHCAKASVRGAVSDSIETSIRRSMDVRMEKKDAEKTHPYVAFNTKNARNETKTNNIKTVDL